MAEYKNCPVCHTINPPTATECECGYRFREGEIITDRDIARKIRKKKLRKAVGSCVIFIVFIFLAYLTLLYGVKVLLYVLGGAVATLAVIFVVLKIMGVAIDRKGKR